MQWSAQTSTKVRLNHVTNAWHSTEGLLWSGLRSTHEFKEEWAHWNGNIHILHKEDGWLERGVKDAIYVRPPLLLSNGCPHLRHHQPDIHNAVLKYIPR